VCRFTRSLVHIVQPTQRGGSIQHVLHPVVAEGSLHKGHRPGPGLRSAAGEEVRCAFRLCSFVHHMGMMRGAFVDYSANVLLFVILVCCPQVEFEVAFEPEFGLNEKEHSMLKGGASVRVDGKLREDWR